MVTWRRIGIEETGELARFAEIMQGMDLRYWQLCARSAQTMMARKGGAFYSYREADYELVMCFVTSHRTGKIYVWSAGYRGAVTKEVAMDRAAELVLAVLRERGARALYAIRPFTMDCTPMQEMHDLFRQHPKLKVTVEGESTGTALWRLEAAGPEAEVESGSEAPLAVGASA